MSQLMMTLPMTDKKDTGLRWVLYISDKIGNRGEMVPLCNGSGVMFFETYESAIIEKHEHPLSVVGIVNLDDLPGTLHNYALTQNVTRLV